jgi:hypothetical protein
MQLRRTGMGTVFPCNSQDVDYARSRMGALQQLASWPIWRWREKELVQAGDE